MISERRTNNLLNSTICEMSPLSNNNATQSETNQISSNSAFKPLMSESRQLLAMSSSASSNEQYTEHSTRKLEKF